MERYVVLSDSSEKRSTEESARNLGAHWARLGDKTVVWTVSEEWNAFVNKARRAGIYLDQAESRKLEGQLYFIIQTGRAFQDAHPEIRIVIEKGRYLVADLLPEEVRRLTEIKDDWWTVRPLAMDSVIMEIVKPVARAAVTRVKANIEAVSESTYSSYLISLVNFLTRYSLSSQYSSAAEWAANQLQSLGYQVKLHPINIGEGSSYNVVADRLGSESESRKLVLIIAHLDSINIRDGANAPAPGADDNASGAAGVLEIARVLAEHPSNHDLRLILFGGEEEGLHGSKQYVSRLPENERTRISAVINMDMVATLNTASQTVLLEGAPVSKTLMEELAGAAATYTSLIVQISKSPFGSDHVPFIDELIPAVLTIEGTDSSNINIHTANDTLDHINYGLALDIIRMNLAVALKLLDTNISGL
ncbi:M28 family metallopeptidase [Methanosarcina sp. UBA5]|uniref:M28 family metallopeptidase n=1 Tax=Methanosarcina sp. UBA5 TaxID=1915593 RepID=UPI0025D6BE17|nr:M28 family metallopeptidase [Methanosarcina sp. UBA5]